MNKFFLQSGAILGALGVMIGAFGAHAFKPMLEATGRYSGILGLVSPTRFDFDGISSLRFRDFAVTTPEVVVFR